MGKVKWTNTKTKVTVTMECSCGDERGKWATKSWKNWCPGCKKTGGLVGHKPPNPNLTKYKGKYAPEGEISCKYCGFDACGVHGREKINGSNKRLKPAASKGSSSSTGSTGSTCEVNKAESLANYKEELKKTKPTFKATINAPILKDIDVNQFCKTNIEGFPTRNKLFIEGLKIDFDNNKMTVDCLDEMPTPGTEYKSDKTNSSSKVNSNVYNTGNYTTMQKKLIQKGKSLGSFNKIWNWLKCGGTGRFKYSGYQNHSLDRSYRSFVKWHEASAKAVWSKKKINCTDISWLAYYMCKGAGVKVQLIAGRYYFKGKGGPFGHMWVLYKGKIWDFATPKYGHSYTKLEVVK